MLESHLTHFQVKIISESRICWRPADPYRTGMGWLQLPLIPWLSNFAPAIHAPIYALIFLHQWPGSQKQKETKTEMTYLLDGSKSEWLVSIWTMHSHARNLGIFELLQSPLDLSDHDQRSVHLQGIAPVATWPFSSFWNGWAPKLFTSKFGTWLNRIWFRVCPVQQIMNQGCWHTCWPMCGFIYIYMDLWLIYDTRCMPYHTRIPRFRPHLLMVILLSLFLDIGGFAHTQRASVSLCPGSSSNPRPWAFWWHGRAWDGYPVVLQSIS